MPRIIINFYCALRLAESTFEPFLSLTCLTRSFLFRLSLKALLSAKFFSFTQSRFSDTIIFCLQCQGNINNNWLPIFLWRMENLKILSIASCVQRSWSQFTSGASQENVNLRVHVFYFSTAFRIACVLN